jgi:hypothetical protein
LPHCSPKLTRVQAQLPFCFFILFYSFGRDDVTTTACHRNISLCRLHVGPLYRIIFHLWISSAWKAGTQDLFGLSLTPVVYSALGLWSLRAWGLRQMDPTGLEPSPSPDYWLSLLRSVQADHRVVSIISYLPWPTSADPPQQPPRAPRDFPRSHPPSDLRLRDIKLGTAPPPSSHLLAPPWANRTAPKQQWRATTLDLAGGHGCSGKTWMPHRGRFLHRSVAMCSEVMATREDVLTPPSSKTMPPPARSRV